MQLASRRLVCEHGRGRGTKAGDKSRVRVTNGGYEAWCADLEYESDIPLDSIWNDIGNVYVDRGGTVHALGETGERERDGLCIPMGPVQDNIPSALYIGYER